MKSNYPKLGELLVAKYTYTVPDLEFVPETWILPKDSFWVVVEVTEFQCRLTRVGNDFEPLDDTDYKNNLTVDIAVLFDIFRRNTDGN